MKKLILISCLLLLIAVGPSLPEVPRTEYPPLNANNIVNSKAPDFTLKDVTAKQCRFQPSRGRSCF